MGKFVQPQIISAEVDINHCGTATLSAIIVTFNCSDGYTKQCEAFAPALNKLKLSLSRVLPQPNLFNLMGQSNIGLLIKLVVAITALTARTFVNIS